MKTQSRSLKALAAQALFSVGLLMAAPACDEGSTEPEAPVQHIESDLPAGVAVALLDAADMGPSDLAAADFAIYSMEEGSEQAREEIPEGCPVKSAPAETTVPFETICGVCMCDGNGSIYCIDWVCGDEDWKSGGQELELATPPLEPSPPAPETEERLSPLPTVDSWDEQSCTPGDTWESDCNVCMCGRDGEVTCTTAACTDELSFQSSLAN